MTSEPPVTLKMSSVLLMWTVTEFPKTPPTASMHAEGDSYNSVTCKFRSQSLRGGDVVVQFFFVVVLFFQFEISLSAVTGQWLKQSQTFPQTD